MGRGPGRVQRRKFVLASVQAGRWAQPRGVSPSIPAARASNVAYFSGFGAALVSPLARRTIPWRWLNQRQSDPPEAAALVAIDPEREWVVHFAALGLPSA